MNTTIAKTDLSESTKSDAPGRHRQKFLPEEDKILSEMVEKLGPKKWNRIAQFLPNRTARQCRDRYCNYLAPGFFNGEWSQKEDDLLYEKYCELGPKWAQMKAFFQSRSPNSLKNRWNYFVSKRYSPVNKMPTNSIENSNAHQLKPIQLNISQNLQFFDQEIQTSPLTPPYSFELATTSNTNSMVLQQNSQNQPTTNVISDFNSSNLNKEKTVEIINYQDEMEEVENIIHSSFEQPKIDSLKMFDGVHDFILDISQPIVDRTDIGDLFDISGLSLELAPITL
ncbi:r2r3-MYB transcription factor [Tritrichomonas foetus]|uniref:R2r3-MYB transcription factor n=1 Tax=Tritrichomonas foetus TaxID=1144522 RepID=A0A1J4K0S5_9EUKA|nr:r2r3-MYB transcription factor [Tritrichomonas foetus]|eukprot:OHT03101.1 r2r3-MYB transcription factor [Tritrichomonas foetus]